MLYPIYCAFCINNAFVSVCFLLIASKLSPTTIKWYIGLYMTSPWKKIWNWMDGHLFTYQFRSNSATSSERCAAIDSTLSFLWQPSSCTERAEFICKRSQGHITLRYAINLTNDLFIYCKLSVHHFDVFIF